MGYKDVPSLNCTTTVTIGGKDKKTQKPNPKQIEGYFLGTKEIGPNKFNKSKMDYVHVLQTKQGNIGVWGKTNLDPQMKQVVPGTMTLITFTGERDTGKGNPMLEYRVQIDESNVIENFKLSSEAEDVGEVEEDGEDYDNDSYSGAASEDVVERFDFNKGSAAERKATVEALLKGNRSAKN